MHEPVNRAIEVSSFAVRGEDVDIEVIANSSLIRVSNAQAEKESRHTRPTAPARITPKLKVCWVVRATFSPVDNCPHGTLPSSLPIVTCFLMDGWFVPARVFDVAYCL